MSRVIIKGLPAGITGDKLKERFDKFGKLTDVSLKYTKEGVFRKFAFIGFAKEECGREAISKLNNTFINTTRIKVEECLPFSADNKPRPWSKYARGSSAYKRLYPDETAELQVDVVRPQTNVKRSKREINNDVESLTTERLINEAREPQSDKKPDVLTSKKKTKKGKVDVKEDPPTDGEVIDERRQKVHDAILDTGRLFIRNLSYGCTESELMEAFRGFGEIADLECIIDRNTGKCKGFALITFIFPDNALAAYEALDGSIFQGRMLHILPGESKPEQKPMTTHDGRMGDSATLSKFQKDRADKLKTSADRQTHVWNPLFLGSNATADTLAERLTVGKRELLTDTGDNSAAVRLALAETQLVKETHDFLERNNLTSAVENEETKTLRSDTTIVVKNLPAGDQFQALLREQFERFGEVKRVEFALGGGLIAVVEMTNKVDAKRAFKLIAYSRLRGSEQPLYLEWAARRKENAGLSMSPMGESSSIKPEADKEETEEEKLRTKLLIRNIPFQATLEEVTQLFTAFGCVRDIRLPKKVGVCSEAVHRGFGFVDYMTHEEAKRASAALRLSTHLYGRRLVVEWAKRDDTVHELHEKAAGKLRNKKAVKGTKKQIRDAVEARESENDD